MTVGYHVNFNAQMHYILGEVIQEINGDYLVAFVFNDVEFRGL